MNKCFVGSDRDLGSSPVSEQVTSAAGCVISTHHPPLHCTQRVVVLHVQAIFGIARNIACKYYHYHHFWQWQFHDIENFPFGDAKPLIFQRSYQPTVGCFAFSHIQSDLNFNQEKI